MKPAHNRVQMVGVTFNSWLILSHSHTNGKIAYYNAKCLDCQGEFVVDGRNVRNGSSKRCVECGFKNGSKVRTGVRKSKLSASEMRLKYLFREKKKLANKRGLAWSISISEFEKLIFSACHYCGIAPSASVNVLKNVGLHSSWKEEGIITYNGIDRIDSSKGYEAGNMVTCCQICNKAKLAMSQADFLAWGLRFSSHQAKIKPA